MDKQLTPIQQAIEVFEKEYSTLTGDNEHWSIPFLKSLLSVEKEFALKAYVAGEQYGRHDIREIETSEKNNSPEFPEYYKRYEHE